LRDKFGWLFVLFLKKVVFHMSYNIAISSTDGKFVNQHFGHTEKFIIVEVKNRKNYRFLEERKVKAPCSFGEHDENTLENATKALVDCKYVLCSQIGGGASRILEENKIRVFTIATFIDEALERIIDYDEKQKAIY
jgi:predicted Fe-Mo cluster-binding NifX family protein